MTAHPDQAEIDRIANAVSFELQRLLEVVQRAPLARPTIDRQVDATINALQRAKTTAEKGGDLRAPIAALERERLALEKLNATLAPRKSLQ